MIAELVGVTKTLGRTRALDGLELGVDAGEVVALLGPNGAGKTTALRILLGLRRPDRGVVRLFGRDPTHPATRRRVGCTPQETSFPGTLRVRELVELVRAHFPAPLTFAELAARFELADLERRQAGGLSGGQKRRLACALAFAGDPELVVLDEPSTGLDVESRLRLWETIGRGEHTVLLTTHDLGEAELLATRVAVIRAGRVVAQGTPGELAAAGRGLQSAYLALTRDPP